MAAPPMRFRLFPITQTLTSIWDETGLMFAT